MPPILHPAYPSSCASLVPHCVRSSSCSCGSERARAPGPCASTAHGRVLGRFRLHLFGLANPQDVIAPYEDLSERARADAAHEFFGVGELDVHVEVDRDESALVLRLTPLEAHDNVFVDAAQD
jgi:hypothetical protein